MTLPWGITAFNTSQLASGPLEFPDASWGLSNGFGAAVSIMKFTPDSHPNR